jgi:S1-C subfamily serine protease
LSTLTDVQETLASVAERVGPAVVGFGRGWGRGSGVVIGPQQVITSAHNLRGEEVTVNFADGRRASGTVVGTDRELDLAAVQVDTGEIEPVPWDRTDPDVALGTAVVALANPGGRGLRATPGFVSAPGRSFRGPTGRRIRNCIEHTAPLPRGSAGGPLVDPSGGLLGLNAIRLEGGLILAVPAGELLARRTDALFRGEQQQRPRLGVGIAPPYVARRLRRAVGLPERAGLLVREVEEGSPAARAGIERGDLIFSADGRELDAVDVLYDALDALEPGAKLRLGVVRGIDERELEISFGETPTSAAQV